MSLPRLSFPRAEDRSALNAMRRSVVLMSLGFGGFLTTLALATHLIWLRQPFSSLFRLDGFASSVAAGAAVGCSAAIAVLVIVRRLPGLKSFRRFAREGYEGIEPRLADILVISLAAGWSEEVFFRGVLQPHIGIWLAAVAFVLVHGAYGVLSRGGRALAIFLFIAGLGLGVLYRWRGLECAMAAHATYDVVILMGLREMLKRGLWLNDKGGCDEDSTDRRAAPSGE